MLPEKDKKTSACLWRERERVRERDHESSHVNSGLIKP
jgi:hypothetical protein